MNRLGLVLILILGAALDFAAWGWLNRPVPVPLSFDEPFASVSFAPFRRGESPLTHDYPTPAEIESDLASLQGVARGVRTYTSREGLQIVPELAGRYGLEVTQSAWLGRKLDANAAEADALIAQANRYPDTIKRVIVGNEVLLREDLTVPQLIGYLRKVRGSIKQPVSYADVWAFWLKHPELADEVDYITVHILPYWEDEPIGVEDAAKHLVMVYKMVQAAFPGKPILIGESGWPTRGRSRGPASATRVNGARFVRMLAQVAKENGFDYNVVEAFDQPWKAEMEGTVGANWGVVDGRRAVKFRMSGPVQENPGWPWQAGAAALLGAIGSGCVAWRRRLPLSRVVVLSGLAQLLAALSMGQAVNAWWLGYDILGDVWGLFRIILHAKLAFWILRTAGSVLEGKPIPARWAERLVPLYGMAAVADTVLLLVHGRYRDIPNLEFLVPCLGVLAFALLRRFALKIRWDEAFAVGRLFAADGEGGFGPAKYVAIGLTVSVLLAPLSEAVALAMGQDFTAMHPLWSDRLPLLLGIMAANTEMLVWSGMLALLSLPYWAELSVRRRPVQ